MEGSALHHAAEEAGAPASDVSHEARGHRPAGAYGAALDARMYKAEAFASDISRGLGSGNWQRRISQPETSDNHLVAQLLRIWIGQQWSLQVM